MNHSLFAEIACFYSYQTVVKAKNPMMLITPNFQYMYKVVTKVVLS